MWQNSTCPESYDFLGATHIYAAFLGSKVESTAIQGCNTSCRKKYINYNILQSKQKLLLQETSHHYSFENKKLQVILSVTSFGNIDQH